MKRNLCLKLRPSEISPSIKTLLVILLAIITISLLSMSALAETNVTLLYGWNSTAWVPLKTSADGTLQTDLNLTQSLSIFPKTDNTYDLGSSGQRWRDLYVAGNAYLVTTSGSVGIGTATISSSVKLNISGGDLVVGSLTSCNTIDTTSNGTFICGSDAGAYNSSYEYWTNATNNLRINTSYEYWTNSSLTNKFNSSYIINGTPVNFTYLNNTFDINTTRLFSSNQINTNWLNTSSLNVSGTTNVSINSPTFFIDTTNSRVGIGTTSPGELLSLGLAGTTKGVLSLSGDTSGKIIIQPAAAAGTYTLTLPTDDGTAGQVLETDGAGILSWGADAGAVDYQAFTSSGTWTKPTGVTVVYVECWGAGGGGGGGYSGTYKGGGGGGGGYVHKVFLASALAATVSVTVNAGGAGGAGGASAVAGSVGGNTTFGAHLTAYGGFGGSPGGESSAGGGAAGGGGMSSGDPSAGANSGAAAAKPGSLGGGGGAMGDNSWTGGKSVYGGGGGGGDGGAGGTTQFGGAGGAGASAGVGGAGTAPGGGGGGGGVNGAGGAGAAGKCLVTSW